MTQKIQTCEETRNMTFRKIYFMPLCAFNQIQNNRELKKLWPVGLRAQNPSLRLSTTAFSYTELHPLSSKIHPCSAAKCSETSRANYRLVHTKSGFERDHKFMSKEEE